MQEDRRISIIVTTTAAKVTTIAVAN